MAATFVQAAKNGVATAASITGTLGASTTAGNFVVVAGMFARAATGVTVTNNSNPGDAVTIVAATFDDTGSGTKTFVQAVFAPTAGSTAFKATFSGTTPTFSSIFVWEFSGLTSPTFDKAVHAVGTAATADSGTSGTLTSADEAAIGFFCSNGTGGTAAGSGWSIVAGDGIEASNATFGEHRVVAATTAINATATGASGSWVAHLATFMAGAAAKSLVFGPINAWNRATVVT
jgi:hypothetical protein